MIRPVTSSHLWALGALIVLAACGPAKHVRRAVDGPSRDEFEQAKIDRAIANNAVILGMTTREVRRSRGNPVRIDWVRKFGGKRVRRWAYSFDEVYFDADGRVIGTHAAY